MRSKRSPRILARLQRGRQRPVSSAGAIPYSARHGERGQDVQTRRGARRAAFESHVVAHAEARAGLGEMRRLRRGRRRLSANAERDGSARMDCGESRHARVVGVQHGDAVGAAALRPVRAWLARRLRCRLEILDVRVADVGDHADVAAGRSAPARESRRRDSCRFRSRRRARPSGRRSSDSGTPMWLLRLPVVLAACEAAWRAGRAITSFVVVLPALPVMPTTSPPQRSRARRPAAAARPGCRRHAARPRRRQSRSHHGGDRALRTAPLPRMLVAVVIGAAQREEQVAGRDACACRCSSR